jgi:phosphotransferase system enzyme I (PtsI)
MLLDDVALRDELAERIPAEKTNAEHILNDMAQRYAKLMGTVSDPHFGERTADLLDVVDRILRHLMDADRPNLKHLNEPQILVTHELSPSDAATMNPESILGLALDTGSLTSHAAILTRALEIPSVMGLGDITSQIQPAMTLIVDGTEGMVILDPSPATLRKYRTARTRLQKNREVLQTALSVRTYGTLDGIEIPTQANIELPVELAHSLKIQANGIGLYRTEYLFLNRNTLPSEDEQYAAYTEAAEAMNPQPVVLRTMDIGGDKFVSHLQISREDNPQLGWRAVRFCLQRPDIFKTQLRAILRASVHGNVSVMFPMISGVEELRQVKAVLGQVKEDLTREEIPFNPDLKVGSMIEVPSAVVLSDALARECDFFSIGTNDLIQYSLAVDRVNEKIAHLYDPAHPAVLRMIEWTARAARLAGIPCGICGEMAGDPLFTEILLGLGISSLSMSCIAIPIIRAEIAQTNVQQAKILAKKLLRLTTAAEVRAMLRKRYANKNAIKAYLTRLNQEEQEGRAPTTDLEKESAENQRINA